MPSLARQIRSGCLRYSVNSGHTTSPLCARSWAYQQKCLGASLTWPIWTATFEYTHASNGTTFPVIYESRINDVPVFDAHVDIYTPSKIVRVNIDTPYTRGLPTTMTVPEKVAGPRKGETAFVERCVRTTYENAYTREFREWQECVVNGKEVKTSVQMREATGRSSR